jgi:hypothetical protein
LFFDFNNCFSKNKIEKVKDAQNILRAMRQLSECRSAASSVIGVVLLVGMTVIMVSVIALSVFAYGAFETQPVPEAKIVMVEASGDTDKPLYKNVIVLKHKGGDMLIKRNTEIIIAGKGYAYTGHDAHPSSVQDKGSLIRIYQGIIMVGKMGTILEK